jgi:hypothetical protein
MAARRLLGETPKRVSIVSYLPNSFNGEKVEKNMPLHRAVNFMGMYRDMQGLCTCETEFEVDLS